MDKKNKPLPKPKQDLSSNPSLFPPNSNNTESSSSAQPPQYENQSQYPPTSGYPQPYGQPAGGQPYYPQPGVVVYPGAPEPHYQGLNPQQLQQQCIIVDNQQTGWHPFAYFGGGQHAVSMTGAIVLSCFAFWCFGWLFGMIAFILAMVGQSSAAAGDIPGAIRLRNASYGVSIAGIVVGVIIIIIVASVISTRYRAVYSYCNYYYSGYGTYGTYICY